MQERSSLTSAIDEWLAGRPAATRRAYVHDVQEFLSAIGGDLAQMDETAFRRWLATFEHRHLAPATMRRKLAAVRSFLRYVHDKGLTNHDLSGAVPAAVRPTSTPLPQLRVTERGRLLAAALHVADPRLQLLLWLVGCGCPLPLVARLRWGDLQPHEGGGIALCQDERDRPLRCVIPGLIWRSLETLKASADEHATVFSRPDGKPATPRDLADAIGWLLDENATGPIPGNERGRDRLLTLSQVAERLRLPETTVRYYRDRFAAYLPVVGEGRSRRYPPQTVERLRWIVEQLRAGLSVHEVERQLRDSASEGAAPASAMDSRLAETVDGLSRRIAELTESLDRLARLLEKATGFPVSRLTPPTQTGREPPGT